MMEKVFNNLSKLAEVLFLFYLADLFHRLLAQYSI